MFCTKRCFDGVAFLFVIKNTLVRRVFCESCFYDCIGGRERSMSSRFSGEGSPGARGVW